MSSADPERAHDAEVPVHFLPGHIHSTELFCTRACPGWAVTQQQAGQLAAARLLLAAELEQGQPCTADRETLLAALRAVWALAERWRAGDTGLGGVAFVEVREAIQGEGR